MAQGGGLAEKIKQLLETPLTRSDIQRLHGLYLRIGILPITPQDRDYIVDLWQKNCTTAYVTPHGDNRHADPNGGSAATNLSRSHDEKAHDALGRSEQPNTWEVRASELSTRIALLERQLADAEAEIDRLRALGKRVVAERDKWERIARDLRANINLADNNRMFQEAKRSFAKLYHPDSSGSLGAMESAVRKEVFKEFWDVLERIERGGQL